MMICNLYSYDDRRHNLQSTAGYRTYPWINNYLTTGLFNHQSINKPIFVKVTSNDIASVPEGRAHVNDHIITPI